MKLIQIIIIFKQCMKLE